MYAQEMKVKREGLGANQGEVLSPKTEIAPELEISVHTVKYHARNVLAKLGLESRLELFRMLATETAQAD